MSEVLAYERTTLLSSACMWVLEGCVHCSGHHCLGWLGGQHCFA